MNLPRPHLEQYSYNAEDYDILFKNKFNLIDENYKCSRATLGGIAFIDFFLFPNFVLSFIASINQ